MIEKLLVGLGAAVVGGAIIAVISALLAFPVMWLWNGVGPNLFATAVIKPIDFWNAWGLSLLCGLLFKGSSSSSSN